MPNEIKKRIRAYKPKVSTGCLTCKARHVKCDEGQPSCEQCSKTGRTCDGYNPSTEKKKNCRFLNTSTIDFDLSIHSSIGVRIKGSNQELRGLDFFRSRTVPQLCGLCDSSFWRRAVLQVTHHEPAIRHAAIALGSLHEELENGWFVEQDRDQSGFASQHYLKAIRCLVQPMQGQTSHSADIALMTCILFVCFETLRGHHGPAFSHIGGGVKILSELQSDPDGSKTFWTLSPSSYVPLKTLNLIFARLEGQVSMIEGTSRILVSDTMDDEDSGYQNKIPASFSSLDEARNSLHHIWTDRSRSVEASLLLCESQQERLLLLTQSKRYSELKVIEWSKAFESLLRQTRSHLDRDSQIKIHVLKIHRIMAGILLSIDYLVSLYDETTWDSYQLEYEAINSHAAAVIKLANNASKPREIKSTFTLDDGIIYHLYLVATKCRQKSVRHKAISILKSAPRQEGILHSILTARVAERLIQFEEQSVPGAEFPEDVPNWARVAGVHIKFDSDGKRAFLKYQRWMSSESTVRETVDECISW